MFAHLAPPESVTTETDNEVRQVQDYLKRRKLPIGQKRRAKFDRYVKDMVESWERNTNDLRRELRELNDFLEGNEEPNDFPWGAQSSQIDVRLAAATARTLRANFIRAVFSDSTFVVAEMAPGKKDAKSKQEVREVEAATNWAAHNDCNLVDELKDSVVPIFRDGTAILHGDWERAIERGYDYKVYENAEEFKLDYPDHETAGVSEEKYNEILDTVETYEETLQVEFELDFVSKNEPVFTLCPLAKFVWWPQYTKEVSELDLYGYLYTESASKFNVLSERDFYYSDVVEAVKKTDGTKRNMWDAARDEVEGIHSEGDSKASYSIAKLVVLYDMDEDGIPERYVTYFEMDRKKSLRIERYGMRRNIPNMVPLRFIRRDGRLLGNSLLRDGEYLYREINALHRHRSNIRKLTDSVTLIIPEGLKDHIDLGAEWGTFTPGTTFWVPDNWPADKYPRQLEIHNMGISDRNSADEEGLNGITQGQSGKESSNDPNAPASKTAMLLNRADIRVEDFIDEWKRTIPLIIDLIRTLYFQNKGGKLHYKYRNYGSVTDKEIPLATFADPAIGFSLKGIRPATAPEMEMNKLIAIAATAIKLQFPVMMRPEIVIELWNDYVSASRCESPERLQIQQGEDGTMSMGGQDVKQEDVLREIMAGVMGQGQVAPGKKVPFAPGGKPAPAGGAAPAKPTMAAQTKPQPGAPKA